MKIVFNVMGLGKGGAERVINVLSNELSIENDVYIITNINSKIEYNFSKKIHIISLVRKDNTFLRKVRRISLIVLLRLRKYILNIKPDVVISFLQEPIFRILFLKKYSKKIKKIPIIITVRNDPNKLFKNVFYYQLMKKLYPYANQIVLQTFDSLQYFQKEINYNGVVIPNPVDDRFLKKRYAMRREKKIVAVGRLHPQKNYNNLINAFEIVHKKYKQYSLEIYGEGKLYNNLQSIITEKKLSKHIFLKGKTDDVFNKINTATAFVMSSDYEGMPNSLLEAACLGVPCVSTDCPCGGPKEILDDGRGGILVPVNDSDALSKGIIDIIEHPRKAKKMAEYSNVRANNYKSDIIIKMWIKEITKIKSAK